MNTNVFGGVGVLAAYFTTMLACPAVLDLSNAVPLASYRCEGLVDISTLGSWNGAPVSQTNMPSEYHRLLGAYLDVFPDSSTSVWLRVRDVISTQGSYWYGSAFTNTLMTRIDLHLTDGTAPIGITGANTDFCNPGQSLLGTLAGPVTSTLGWTLDSNALRTVAASDYGFAEYGWVTGAVIQEGGGLFRLDLSTVWSAVSWQSSSLTVTYGNGNQTVPSTLTFAAVPVAGSFLSHICLCCLVQWRCRARR